MRRAPPYVLSHPFTSDRVEALRERVESAPHYNTTDSEDYLHRFAFMQAKLVGFLRSQGQTLARYPLSEVQHLSPRGLGSMSRGFVDERTNSLIAAFRYPGRIGFVGRMDLATGKLTALADLDGMMLYKVTSVAFDPDARTAYYTEDNYAFRDLIAVNVDTGRKRMLLRGWRYP